MTALPSGRAKPRRSLLARAVFGLDSLLRRREHVFEYTDDPQCLFRAQLSKAAHDVVLSDGTELTAGDPIVVLHMWNEQIPKMGNSGATLAWASRGTQRLVPSLAALEHYLEANQPQVKAIYGESGLTALPAIARIASRIGFEEVDRGWESEGRLHKLGEQHAGVPAHAGGQSGLGAAERAEAVEPPDLYVTAQAASHLPLPGRAQVSAERGAMSAADELVFAFAGACGLLAGVGCIYLAAAGILVLRFRRNDRAAGGVLDEGAFPSVTVLVPLCGDEPGLTERLMRLRGQDYPAPVQIVCGVRDPHDTALAPVSDVASQPAPWPLDRCVDPRLHGRNNKVSNLINMMELARHEVLVLIDSDMRVEADYLRRVVAELAGFRDGAVTCLYRGEGAGGLPARLAAAGIDMHFLPSIVVGLALGWARPCFGATIALRRETLQRIGGLKAFADQLWDDYAIGWAVRAHGASVGVCDFAPVHVCTDKTFKQLLSGQIRAARTVRGIDPRGHAGAVVTHPLPFALLALALTLAWWAWSLLAAALLLRYFVARCVDRRFGASVPSLPLLPARDLLSFFVYVASYFGAAVQWRGESFRVDGGGSLTPKANRGTS